MGGSHANIKAYASGINPTGATENFLRARQAGYTAFKLKIGFGDAIDYANIEGIAAQLQPNEQLMVDANQAWTLEEAMVQVEHLADYPLTWLEEPIMAGSSAEDWLALAHESTIPLAAGENLCSSQAFSSANAADYLAFMLPDMCKWGGFSGVLPVAKEALRKGKTYCPHFLGGGIGLSASAHLLVEVGCWRWTLILILCGRVCILRWLRMG